MDLYRIDDWAKKTVHLVKREPYEPLFETSLNEIQSSWNIIDVGAAVGHYTIPMAKRASNGKVYSIECHPYLVQVLRKNIQLHNLNNVTIITKAVSEKVDEKIELMETLTPGGTNIRRKDSWLIDALRLFRNNLFRIFGTTRYSSKIIGFVQTDTLDNLFSKQSLKIDLIKMDIQGLEYKALLSGALKILIKDKPMLLVEVHKRRYFGQSDFLKKLRKLGYSLTVDRIIGRTELFVKAT